MRTNKNQYDKMVRKASPKSHLLKNCLWAFFTGGGQYVLQVKCLSKHICRQIFPCRMQKALPA